MSMTIDPTRELSFTAVAAGIVRVDQAVSLILARIGSDRFTRKLEKNVHLDGLYGLSAPPGGAHLFKVVLNSPTSDEQCTVLTTNVADGWNSLMYLLSKELRATQVQILSSSEDADWPIQRFEIWRDGRRERVVSVIKEEHGWEFFAEGTIQSFEEPASYDNRYVKNRLTRDLLALYLRRIGVYVGAPEYQMQDSINICYSETRKS